MHVYARKKRGLSPSEKVGVYSSVSHRSRSRARQKRLATPVRSLIGRQSRRFLPIREICSRGGVVPVCRLDLRGGSVEIIVAR